MLSQEIGIVRFTSGYNFSGELLQQVDSIHTETLLTEHDEQ